MQNPEVSVVMVNRGLWPMTKKAIETMIFTADRPWFLYFLSNGSEDETYEEFTRISPTWKWQYFCGYDFYHHNRSESLAAAWNYAFNRLPKTKYTIFANNDIVFHQAGWMSKLIDAVDAGFGLVGIQEMTWHHFRFVEGSLFCAKTETLEALKEGKRLFDIQFKLSCEDVDLSRRALKADLQIGQVHGLQPDYLVHIGHQSLQHFGHTEDLQSRMHNARRALCKKWNVPLQVED